MILRHSILYSNIEVVLMSNVVLIYMIIENKLNTLKIPLNAFTFKSQHYNSIDLFAYWKLKLKEELDLIPFCLLFFIGLQSCRNFY